jgi:hypothetical protein
MHTNKFPRPSLVSIGPAAAGFVVKSSVATEPLWVIRGLILDGDP